MMTNEIITELYKELKLEAPRRVPEKYKEPVRIFADSFVGKNQLPTKDCNGHIMYPMNKELVYNRSINQILRAVRDKVDVPATANGVEVLLTKNPEYPIMLNGIEERALCFAAQESKKIESRAQKDFIRDIVSDVAITFLSPRIKFIYKRFEKAIGVYRIYNDVVQEMMMASFKMLEDFDFTRTQAGLTRDYVNRRLYRAINNVLQANRSATMAQETWNKVSQFVNTPEDHSLTREEIKQKYHCTPGLIDIMYALAENGSLEVSLDYTFPTSATKDNRTTTFGEHIAAKDYSKEELELDSTLQRILSPVQYQVIRLKMDGYGHKAIAKKLGFPTKRKSQYIFLLARNIIEKEFDVDVNLYTKGRAKHRKRPEDSLNDEELYLTDDENLENEDLLEEEEEDEEDVNFEGEELEKLNEEFGEELEEFQEENYDEDLDEAM